MSSSNSVLTESNNKDLQIWNNLAFDNGGSDFIKSSSSWSPPLNHSAPLNQQQQQQPSDSIDSSLSCKENQTPSGFSKSVSVVAVHHHRSTPLKNLPIDIGFLDKTDEEIEIENEILRLYAKLESIRLKRSEENLNKNVEKTVQVLKNVEEKPERKTTVVTVKNRDLSGPKKIQESSKIQRRGFSLGPNEIMSATNPKSKQSGVTPITQNRRKSCFWKLDDIEEEKTGVSRGKNPSLRNAVTTGGAKKSMKKDDFVLASVQPKKLFGEQSAAKKPLKPGRVVASRYNQATVTSSMRKKSLTENSIKTRGAEGRVKRKWEIPGEIVIPKRLDLESNDDNESEGSVVDVVMVDALPRIRAVRYVDDTGRDSGPAKRVAELVGKKSYFVVDDEEGEEEERVCQRLSFDEE